MFLIIPTSKGHGVAGSKALLCLLSEGVWFTSRLTFRAQISLNVFPTVAESSCDERLKHHEEKMKIAFVSQGFGRIAPPKASGSISIWTYEVIDELRKTECVIAYEMDGNRAHSKIKDYNGVRYFFAPTLLNQVINRLHQAASRTIRALNLWQQSPKKPSFASIFHNLGYILWVSTHLRSQRCDVIHIHQWSQYVPVLRLFNPKAKLVLHMHSEWLNQLDKKLMSRRLAKTDLILGCSDYITEKIRREFPEFSARTKTVYNGANHEKFKRRSKEDPGRDSTKPKLLFVGRMSPEKGVHVLIEAVRKLVTDYPAVHLSIVGGVVSAPKEFVADLSDDELKAKLMQFYGQHENGDDYYSYLQQMVDDRIASNITFTGKIPYDKVADLYEQADILVNPSLSEPFGMSLVEAMASEKPVVATRVGGMVNIVDEGVTGLLVDCGSEEKLAGAIRYLIENPDLRNRMGKAGRERVMNKFSWERVSHSLLVEYRKLFGIN